MIFAAAICVGATLAYAADCSLRTGMAVTLTSDPTDPNVMVWDSRERLVAWAGGRWSSSHEVMAHTVIARPGTHAQVVNCVIGEARPRVTEMVRDIIGVRITSGPLRGRYGWVIAGDVHVASAAQRR